MSSAPPRLLTLTAPYGSGHTRAASILAAEFRRAGAVPTAVDHVRDLVHPAFDRWSRALYRRVDAAEEIVDLVLGDRRLALERAS